MLNCDALSENGADPSRDSVMASFPLVCSKKTPYPPRMAILPSPFGSHANQIRGAGLNRCPFRHPAWLLDPTVASGNELVTRLGLSEAPPEPPPLMIPVKE